MLLGYFSFVALFLLFLFWVKKNRLFQLGKLSWKFSFVALFLKISAGFALWFIYTYYYTNRMSADIYKYYDDALHLFNSTQKNWPLRFELLFGFQNDSALFPILKDTQFWYSSSEIFFNDNRTMTRIHLAILHFSGGLYSFHVLFFAILSFIGSCGIFQFFRKSSNLSDSILFAFCFLVPSFLFWNSAPLKETVLIFGLGLLLFGIANISEIKSFRNFTLLTLGILTLLSLKIYILFALVPGLWFWTTSLNKSKVKIRMRYIGIHILMALFLFSSKASTILADKQAQFKTLIQETNASSAIAISPFDSFWSLLITIPQALFNVLVRPIYPTTWNSLSLLSAAEHLFLISILILPLIWKKATSITEQRLVLFCISFVLVSSCVIGLTVPVLGGIVRYKAPLLPFYLLAIFTVVDLSKISPKLS